MTPRAERHATQPVPHASLAAPIPLSRPPLDDELRRAVLAAMDSRHYILGPQCRALEAELACATGVEHAVLTSSATAALWLTLRALGVKPGDEILVPSHTAFPTVEAICLAEATPLFVDADEFYTLDLIDARAKATSRTVGIIPVHLYGQPADLTAVQALACRLRLWVLEDCAQAQGAQWHGRRVGSFGRAAALSFYPSKNLPAMGDGGAGLPLVLPAAREYAHHVYHLFVIRTPRRAELAAFLKAAGVQTGIHYPVPTHRQPAMKRLAPPPLPRTEALVEEILSLPMSADHTNDEIDCVIDAIHAFFGG